MLIPPVGGSVRANAGGGKQSAAITSHAASIGRASSGRTYPPTEAWSPVNGIRSGSNRSSNRPKFTTWAGGENGTQSAGGGRSTRPRLAPLDPGALRSSASGG